MMAKSLAGSTTMKLTCDFGDKSSKEGTKNGFYYVRLASTLQPELVKIRDLEGTLSGISVQQFTKLRLRRSGLNKANITVKVVLPTLQLITKADLQEELWQQENHCSSQIRWQLNLEFGQTGGKYESKTKAYRIDFGKWLCYRSSCQQCTEIQSKRCDNRMIQAVTILMHAIPLNQYFNYCLIMVSP